MSVSVRIDGDDEARRLLHSTGSRLEEAMKGAIAETAINIERNAKHFAPVDTGRLRASIGKSFDDDRLGAEVSANTEYAEYVEYGTTRAVAQPFMGPALDHARDDFRDIVFKHARRVIG